MTATLATEPKLHSPILDVDRELSMSWGSGVHGEMLSASFLLHPQVSGLSFLEVK